MWSFQGVRGVIVLRVVVLHVGFAGTANTLGTCTSDLAVNVETVAARLDIVLTTPRIANRANTGLNCKHALFALKEGLPQLCHT